MLGEVTGLVDGVAHVEIDAEHHLEATRTLGILRTPTTIVLDAAGAEVTRATGAPTRDQVLTALGARRDLRIWMRGSHGETERGRDGRSA